MSSAWTPAKGMLVAFEGGWHVAGPESSPTVLNVGTRLLAHAYAIEEGATPLAPAPTPGGLRDALKGLPGAEVTRLASGEVISIKLEEGNLYPDDTGCPYALDDNNDPAGYRDAYWVTDRNADAVERDLQKRRAIAAYAAQPGWGGGDG